MAIIFKILAVLAVIVAVRAYDKRKEITEVFRKFNAERKAQREAWLKERERQRAERYMKAMKRFSNLTADEMKDAKKMSKAIEEAFGD